MKLLYSFIMLLLLTSCTTTSDTKGTLKSPAVSKTATAETKERLSPLVAKYLKEANNNLPRTNDVLTIESVDLVGNDIVTIFLYDNYKTAIANDGVLYSQELRKICLNPMYAEILNEGINFYTRTVTRDPNEKDGNLSPVLRDYCAQQR